MMIAPGSMLPRNRLRVAPSALEVARPRGHRSGVMAEANRAGAEQLTLEDA